MNLPPISGSYKPLGLPPGTSPHSSSSSSSSSTTDVESSDPSSSSGKAKKNLYQFDEQRPWPYQSDRMYVYEPEMRKHDLSAKAIQEFAAYIEDGNLGKLKELFAVLSPGQKEGLLKMVIDYLDIFGAAGGTSAYGFGFDLARKFKHEDVAEFLKGEMDQIPNVHTSLFVPGQYGLQFKGKY
jgi:hypothetical protein